MCFKSVNIKPYTLFIPVVQIVKPEIGTQSATEQIRAGKDSESALCSHGKPKLLNNFIPQGPKMLFSEWCWFVGVFFA